MVFKKKEMIRNNNTEVSSQISLIFRTNQIEDLNKFMRTRACLNGWNFYMKYLFYVVQSSGIFITTLATGYGWQHFVWLGVGLTTVASLIHVFEQHNSKILYKLLKDINRIKIGDYVDEDVLIDLDDERSSISKQRDNV